MAENNDGQERSEEPTPKRLEEARRKGQIPRSRELNTTLMTLFSAAALIALGDDTMSYFMELLGEGLSLDRRAIFDRRGMIEAMGSALGTGLLLLLPFFAINVITALLSSVMLGGLSFSLESLEPKFSKLNPLKGMKRMFSQRGLVELVKSVAKFCLVGTVGIVLLKHFEGELLGLAYESTASALRHAGHILAWSFLVLSSTLIVIALVDVPYQLWDHGRNLKMTKQEVRDEAKDSEGKPEVKSRIRQLQREAAQRRMMEAVPEADVVITNPTHFAVALKYDERAMGAPRVVAKGSDLVAAQIRERALASNVPLFSAPPLARAIYYSTKLDQEIPAGLYFAVAQVLAYVYQLKTAGVHGGGVPEAPGDLQIPDEYYRPPVDDTADD
ncbi:flagellar biosynthesis protein FlhB [Thiohalobacter sp. IOR34]|uniref:flagellar biosynthesis protein FlhB n=1 Tax=Thiohalobacter sp. IOR34 TaxID=3057176 RepID=UPI0025B1A8E3|nr:flagellar biosynthesis protein FlhB [Thiohalobacter sp. IOR34]WJW74562.1 flagellar biosynthesis protein FlhB [Thiohalobacter sp. IOR34]